MTNRLAALFHEIKRAYAIGQNRVMRCVKIGHDYHGCGVGVEISRSPGLARRMSLPFEGDSHSRYVGLLLGNLLIHYCKLHK